ncbi:MAG: MMPL family transporter [Solirubrobacterales bacterium]
MEAATGQTAEPAIVALVDAGPRSKKVADVANRLEHTPGIGMVVFPVPKSPLVSSDGHRSLVGAAILTKASETKVGEKVQSEFSGDPDVELGGNAITRIQVLEQATQDLRTAELIAFPLLAILTFLFFRGVAALLPLVVGGTTVLGAFAVLRLINVALPLSPFALNLVIGTGLGLAVDYSLLSVSRFREEIGRGSDPPTALLATLRSAGHTILFSALTVAAALACLCVFPQRFLVSMGIGGAVAAFIAAAATFLVLPPMLILLAPRLGKVTPRPPGEGRWYALARKVTRRPTLVAGGAAALMLLLAAPILKLDWTSLDATSLPGGKSSRTVFEAAQREFPRAQASPVFVAVEAPRSGKKPIMAYRDRLERVDGVKDVGVPVFLKHDVWRLEVVVPGAPSSEGVQSVVSRLRGIDAPFPSVVGGSAAETMDSHAAVSRTVGFALALLVILTCTALWLMTGSVLLPIKALAMNFLTLAAATGVMVFIFQDGNLAGLLGATPQAGVEQTDYLVTAAIVFGLSTDYGIFLLSRIKEAHDGGASNEEAVARGLEYTGSVVSAAAVLMAVVLGAFVTSGMVVLKEVGVGAGVAVLLDAFVVRALLVPSLMMLLGRANWWSPRPLRRLHEKLGPRPGTAQVKSSPARVA